MDAVRKTSVICLSGVRVCDFYFILRYPVNNLLFFFPIFVVGYVVQVVCRTVERVQSVHGGTL